MRSGSSSVLQAARTAAAVLLISTTGLGRAAEPALALSADPSPLAARYGVTVTPRSSATREPAPVRRVQWYFIRDAERVALLKGNIDEAWHRDTRGRLSFERAFHDEQRVADYGAGELATLGVRADWSALSSFIDPKELALLRVVARSGRGEHERVRLEGAVAGQSLRVDWLPALQLPGLISRRNRDGGSTRIELERHAAVAPADWPVPGERSAGYLRLDAADFGDMDYEPVVRKSEALDVRGGWRSAHGHD